MSWELVGLAIIAVIGILLVIFRKNPYVKKYWKYTLILIPAAGLLIIVLINKRRGTPDEPDTTLPNAINDIRDDIQEASMTAAVEVSAAKAKNQATLDQLAEIKKIKDKQERLRRLAALVG